MANMLGEKTQQSVLKLIQLITLLNLKEIFDEEFFGPLIDFLNKLCGRDGKTWLTEFKKFLRKGEWWEEVGPSKFNVKAYLFTGQYFPGSSRQYTREFKLPMVPIIGLKICFSQTDDGADFEIRESVWDEGGKYFRIIFDDINDSSETDAIEDPGSGWVRCG